MPKRSDKGTRLLDEGPADAAPPQGSQQPNVAVIQAQVDNVANTMRENVNVMVENIEKGNNLEARSADLATQARQFHTYSRRTSRAMWWQNCKMKLICWGVIIAGITVLSLAIAGGNGAFDPKPSPPSPGPGPP